MQDYMPIVKIAIAKLMCGGINLSKKKKSKTGKQKDLPKNKKPIGMIGAGTKCRFCGTTVPLANAWNCCYADKYDTAINFQRGIAKVTEKEVDLQEDQGEIQDGKS